MAPCCQVRSPIEVLTKRWLFGRGQFLIGLRNSGKPLCIPQSETVQLFDAPTENSIAGVVFHTDSDTGARVAQLHRNDEIPRQKIPASGWPRFLVATMKEWISILSTGAATILCPQAAAEIREHFPDCIVPSRHVYKEKPGEGLGSCSSAKCRWCVLGHRGQGILELERAAPTPQTTSINVFLLVAACLQRELTLGDLKTAFLQSAQKHGDRPKGNYTLSFHQKGFRSKIDLGFRMAH